MGIRVFKNQVDLLREGWNQITLPYSLSRWVSGDNPVEDWCLNTLQGEFSVAVYTSRQMVGFFKLEQDAALFALRWS